MAALRNVFVKNSKYIQVTNCIYKKYFHESANLLKENGENVRERLFVPLQKEKPKVRRKVSVIGATGKVGSAISYNLLIGNYCDEVVMVDRKESKDKLCGETLDMIQASPLHRTPKFKLCMDFQNTKDSDLIIISAGIPHKPGQTRLDLLKDNAAMFKEFVPIVAKLSPNSVILIASNPVDIMTYITWKLSGFAKNRVIGTGTELDSARFRYHIGKRIGVNPKCVTGWIIGEHGDSSVPAWSSVEVAGCRLRDIDPKVGDFCEDENGWNELHKQVVRDGNMLIEMKGWTNWGISYTLENIARSVLHNNYTIHAVSTQVKGIHGITSDCFMSVPCILGNRGVNKVLNQILSKDEQERLCKSAEVLEKHMQSVQI